MFEYEIQVARVKKDYQLVTVQADNETLARSKAMKVAKDNPDAFCDGNTGRFVTSIMKRTLLPVQTTAPKNCSDCGQLDTNDAPPHTLCRFFRCPRFEKKQ